MKRIATVLFAASAMLACAAHAQNQGAASPASQARQPNPGNVADANDPAVKAAIDGGSLAAQRWLALADADNWSACWAALAPVVKGQVAENDFSAGLGAVRAKYGAVKARHAHSVTFTHKLPGAPDGDYVVLQYDTEFAKGGHAIETLTPMRLPDGSWKVSGYYVR